MPDARSWSLRVATPDDAAQVSALLDRSYGTIWVGHYDPDLIATVRPFVTRANPKLLASGTYFLAEAPDGLAVGCGGWTHEAPGTAALEDGVAHIRHFATDPDWLRLGIAAAMLRRCMAEAKASGAVTLFADSALCAEGFYGAFGFEVQGPTAPLINGHPLSGVLMRLAL
jgi:N-acetylglutamate synthase-like GNAT family acetyltransferase